MHKSNGANGAKKLQRQMAHVRDELTEDVQDIRARVQSWKDWRTIVKKHPWAIVAGAAAIGYLLVPKRPRIVYADSDTLAKVATQQPLKVEASEVKHPSMLGNLVRSAGSTAFHGLVAMAGRQLGHIASHVVSDRVGEASERHDGESSIGQAGRQAP